MVEVAHDAVGHQLLLEKDGQSSASESSDSDNLLTLVISTPTFVSTVAHNFIDSNIIFALVTEFPKLVASMATMIWTIISYCICSICVCYLCTQMCMSSDCLLVTSSTWVCHC